MSAIGTSGPEPIPKVTRGVIQGAFGIAVAYVVLVGLFGLVGIAGALISGKIRTVLPLDGLLPAAADAGTATLVLGTYESAEVAVAGLDAPTLIVFAVAALAALASAVAAAVVVAVLCRRLLSGEPFRRGLGRIVTVGGAVVAIGGVISTGLAAFLSFLIAGQLNSPDRPDPFWPLVGAIDGGPVTIGVVMLLVGLAFQYGERLQRDAAGLV